MILKILFDTNRAKVPKKIKDSLRLGTNVLFQNAPIYLDIIRGDHLTPQICSFLVKFLGCSNLPQ